MKPTKSTHKFDIGDKVYHNGEEALVKSHEGVNTMGDAEYYILYSDISKGDCYVMEPALSFTKTCPTLSAGAANKAYNIRSEFMQRPFSKKESSQSWKAAECECGQEDAPWIIHSSWCKLHKKGN